MGCDQVNWFDFLERITAVDLLDAGACISGVKEAVEKNSALAMNTSEAIQLSEWAAKAAHSDGDGDGDGDGYGYGYGDGDGYGYGYGYGYGDGDGYGYGSGYGSGTVTRPRLAGWRAAKRKGCS